MDVLDVEFSPLNALAAEASSLHTATVYLLASLYSLRSASLFTFSQRQPGQQATVALTKAMWPASRTYLESTTKTGPDDNELLYDQTIYFGPYFDEP